MKATKYIPLYQICIIIFIALLFVPTKAFAAESYDVESEDNNMIDISNELRAAVPMSGNLNDRNDIDCFKITSSITGDILFHFDHEGDGVYVYYWYAQVIASDKITVLSEGTLSGREPTDFTVSSVEPGTYYVKISAISGGNPLTNGFTTARYMITATPKCTSHKNLSEWETTINPGCKSNGERIKKCLDCGETVNKETVKSKGHKYSDWTTEKEAEFLSLGVRKRTCTVCKHVESDKFIAFATVKPIVMGAAALVAIIIFVIILIVVIKFIKRHNYWWYSLRRRIRSKIESKKKYPDLPPVTNVTPPKELSPRSAYSSSNEALLKTDLKDSRNGEFIYYNGTKFVDKNGKEVPENFRQH